MRRSSSLNKKSSIDLSKKKMKWKVPTSKSAKTSSDSKRKILNSFLTISKMSFRKSKINMMKRKEEQMV